MNTPVKPLTTLRFHGGRFEAAAGFLEIDTLPELLAYKREPVFDPNAKPIWEIVEEISREVPPAEWARVPTDGARNLDHYLYGQPKVAEE